MMLTPKPTQLSGARFLAARKYALLADEPRVGKTGAAIIACDLVVARRVLVITTKSGGPVWLRGFASWQAFPRQAIIFTVARLKKVREAIASGLCAVIISWAAASNPVIAAELLSHRWDVVIPDEDHYAKSYESARTRALYGTIDRDGQILMQHKALCAAGDRVWPLTGSPYPHDLSDGYARLRALAPHMLLGDASRRWPDVTIRENFKKRYCRTRMKQLSNIRWIEIVVGGQNEDEFRERFGPFMLLRTQKDVGIQPPVYDIMPLEVSQRVLREVELIAPMKVVMDAIKAGNTSALEMHLGPLMRLTGSIKAHAVVEALKEEFECGLDKIVLAYWHKDVGNILEEGLAKYGVLKVDGSVDEKFRAQSEAEFRKPKGPRIMLAQIAAAGEAIDLSAAAVLWFVESVISPKGMQQMSLRITNYTQTRTPLVKVCTLINSIDEPIQAALMRLWFSIKKGIAA